MKALFPKQLSRVTMCFAVLAISVGCFRYAEPNKAANAQRTVVRQLLLADGGQETHGGKGHLIRMRPIV